MRIIAGALGGRQFEAPQTNRTHPMSERMRGALFNTLGDISGLTILDTFGGSGALSFEALSRGAKNSLVIEIDKSAYNTIITNAKKLGLLASIKAVRANVSAWSDNNSDRQFNLVLCNPPFDNLKASLIQKLIKHLAEGGTFVLSWPTRTDAPDLTGLQLASVKEKDYGDAQLLFYQAVSGK